VTETAARPVPGWRAWAGTVRALSWTDRTLLLQAACALVVTAPLVRVFGIRRLTARFGQSLPPAGRAPVAARDVGRARTIARMVAMASRHTVGPSTCLHRSLTLWWLLGRHRIPSDFVLGARKEEGGLAAHAWVEYRGKAINDDPDVVSGYLVLSRTRRG
jgi:hypothetical protein